jgi:hypothetical protein
MYSDKLVVALKSQNKILREFKDTVYCPFGSEYSIFIKNLNTVRCLVSVYIDGTDISEGTSFIIKPNDSIDLERFVKNGNMESGNKFKFIERTSNIENHRGITAEDGLIRVEFKFEKTYGGYNPLDTTRDYYFSSGRGTKVDSLPRGIGGAVAGSGEGYYSNNINSIGSVAMDYIKANPDIVAQAQSINTSCQVNDVGITAPGSVSDQKFTKGNYFPTESISHVIVLKIVGELNQQLIKEPVTVKNKPTCESCGKVNKATAKFCSECGTSLTII